ncbi:MAG: hypothetical protein IIX70_07610, partial [Oscillospiraceae bacterium]|nr:hypothetical protein [Oscillospiraceae bacterium]
FFFVEAKTGRGATTRGACCGERMRAPPVAEKASIKLLPRSKKARKSAKRPKVFSGTAKG